MFKNRRLFYMKLLSFLLLLSIIPVIIVGVFSYLNSSESIQSIVAKEKEYNVYQTQLTIEQGLKQVDQSLGNFAMSPLTNQLLDEPLRPNQFPLYRNIKKELNNLQRFDTGVRDILFINTDQHWLIRNNGLRKLTKDDAEVLKKYESLANRSTWLVEDRNSTLNDNILSTCKRYLNMVKQIPISSIQNKGFIVAMIPLCQIDNRVAMDKDTGSTLILNEKMEVLIDKEGLKEGNNFTESDLVNEINNQIDSRGQFKIEYNNDMHHITYSVSDYNGWTYINMIQLNELNKTSNAIGWFTFYISLFIVIFLIIIAIIGSGKLYQPINRLTRTIKNFERPQGESEKKDEFQIIERHIHQILDQNETLENRMQSQRQQIQQFLINKLVQGKISEKEMKEKLLTKEEDKTRKWFALLAIQVDSLENTPFKRTDEDIILFSINSIVKELINEDKRLSPIVYENKQLTILSGNEDEVDIFNKHVEVLAHTLKRTTTKLLKVPISIGISNTFMNLNKTNFALQESEAALRQALVVGEEEIIYYNKIEAHHTIRNFYPKQIEHDLFEAIKLHDFKDFENYLNKFLDSIFNKELSYIQYEVAMVRLLNNLLELSEKLAIDLDSSNDRQTYIYHLHQFKTKKEVEKWLKDIIIFPIMLKLKQRTESFYSTLSEQVIHIIQEEYDHPLSLEIIADRMHYNSSYLSSIFRKETNMSFSEYLAQYRLDIAKKWLESTAIPVKVIAERLQYNNSQNFIRSFRKQLGMTPGKYRSNLKEE